jgi:hypothetical protein
MTGNHIPRVCHKEVLKDEPLIRFGQDSRRFTADYQKSIGTAFPTGTLSGSGIFPYLPEERRHEIKVHLESGKFIQ